MKLAKWTVLLVAALASVSVAAQSKKNQMMLNVEFKTDLDGGTDVQMSLPFEVLESFRGIVNNALEQAYLETEENAEVNFYEIWKAVRDSPPMDFIEISNEEADIKVATTETQLLIKLDTVDTGLVNVTIPLFLGDALFGNPETQVDFDAVIRLLEESRGNDLILIEGEHINGRVWVL